MYVYGKKQKGYIGTQSENSERPVFYGCNNKHVAESTDDSDDEPSLVKRLFVRRC